MINNLFMNHYNLHPNEFSYDSILVKKGFLIGIFRVVEQNILVESRNVSLGEHNIIRNLEIDAFFDKPIA